MTTNALISVACPHCNAEILQRAKLVRAGGQAWCPDCESLFELDPGIEAMRRTLSEARAARRDRKQRITEMRARWSDPVPAPPTRPMLMSDVLRTLDDLLARMDTLSQRERG